MKRPLTYEEVISIIDMEDKCGVNNLLQEIFQYTNKDGEVKLGRDIEVLCEINDKDKFGEYEVRRKNDK